MVVERDVSGRRRLIVLLSLLCLAALSQQNRIQSNSLSFRNIPILRTEKLTEEEPIYILGGPVDAEQTHNATTAEESTIAPKQVVEKETGFDDRKPAATEKPLTDKIASMERIQAPAADDSTAPALKPSTKLNNKQPSPKSGEPIATKTQTKIPPATEKKSVIKVFILLGQSNMFGKGVVNGEWEGTLQSVVKRGRYPWLKTKTGEWAVHQSILSIQIGRRSQKLQVADRTPIGPEHGIGHVLGDAMRRLVLLKSCTGNRSLGWDLLPPGSQRFKYQGRVYAGYHESPKSWVAGGTPEPKEWYAGKQYDEDIGNAQKVLQKGFKTQFRDNPEYEIGGFFFWQGDKDTGNEAHAKHYERNLKNLIQAVRKDFDAPNAPFVLATLGQTEKGTGGNEGDVLNAQLNVADGEKHPEFKGNVATVYTYPLSQGGTSHMHYNGNAETFMDVGIAMGNAMKELLNTQ